MRQIRYRYAIKENRDGVRAAHDQKRLEEGRSQGSTTSMRFLQRLKVAMLRCLQPPGAFSTVLATCDSLQL